MAKQHKRNIHLICNAHLDPVWLWEISEGMAETLSTFRTAVELCEKDASFIFNHNESILYDWVRRFDPELFKRIQKLVKVGRWNIMGGWFLQPDCNMPSGESFIRQIQVGKQFFKEYFGVGVTTAINFDPFGHSRGLVQIMKKAGFDSYLFGRPLPNNIKLPGEDFLWIGFDGSEILARRFHGWYNTDYGQARENIEERIKTMPSGDEPMAILWGVGNHGGGPSRKDLKDVNQLIQQRSDVNIMHSTPQRYFKEMQSYQGRLKAFDKGLNSWGTGCYTSMARIKQKHRQLENELFATEKMVSAAAMQGLMEYPQHQFAEAQRDLLFSQFHDSLPGSSIEPVEESLRDIAGHGLKILSDLKTEAFFALSRGQKRAKEGQIPVLVYNPHAYPINSIVECEFNMAEQFRDGRFGDYKVYSGKKYLPSQVEQELANMNVDWRKRVAFRTELLPGMNRFDCIREIKNKKPAIRLKKKNNKYVFKTKELLVEINTRTGLVDKWKVNGKACSGAKTFEPLVIEDIADSWGMFETRYRKAAGRFTLMSRNEGTAFSGLKNTMLNSVRVIEDGPVRTVVESLLSYHHSFIVLRYKLPKQGTEIELEMRVYWNEKDKMLKLSVPVNFKEGTYSGQTAYGVDTLCDNGDEVVAQKWTMAASKAENLAVSCINDGTYGSDYSNKGIRLTLLRGCGYATEPNVTGMVPMPDRFTPRMDQGERKFTFWFNAGTINDRIKKIDREALAHNEKPFSLSFFPQGNTGAKPKPAILVSGDGVQISAFRKALKGNDYIIRLFEPTGRAKQVKLKVPVIGKQTIIKLQGFEIKTLKINPRTGRMSEVNLMENKIK